MSNIWKKKTVDQILREHQSEGHSLKRTLTRTNLILLGVGAIIGAGIFVLTGQAAAVYAGPGITLSFVIAGIACAFAGLCYAEFASMIPISGSAYSYAYSTLGEFVAWIIGWDLILEYLFGASTVAVGWSGYVVSFLHDLGLHLPEKMTSAPISYNSAEHVWSTTGAVINFPAMFIVGILTTLLILGIRESATINNIVVLIKVTVILLFLGFGMSYINTSCGDFKH